MAPIPETPEVLQERAVSSCIDGLMQGLYLCTGFYLGTLHSDGGWRAVATWALLMAAWGFIKGRRLDRRARAATKAGAEGEGERYGAKI